MTRLLTVVCATVALLFGVAVFDAGSAQAASTERAPAGIEASTDGLVVLAHGRRYGYPYYDHYYGYRPRHYYRPYRKFRRYRRYRRRHGYYRYGHRPRWR